MIKKKSLTQLISKILDCHIRKSRFETSRTCTSVCNQIQTWHERERERERESFEMYTHRQRGAPPWRFCSWTGTTSGDRGLPSPPGFPADSGSRP